jgi:hypothetical protein
MLIIFSQIKSDNNRVYYVKETEIYFCKVNMEESNIVISIYFV